MESQEEEEPLPDWVQLPDHMHLRRMSSSPIHFRLMGTDVMLLLAIRSLIGHNMQVENQVSLILNVLPHFLEFEHDGENWTYDHGPRHGVVMVRTPERGGMRRPISPTMPFTGQQGSGSSSSSMTPRNLFGRPRSSRSRSRDETRVRQGHPVPEYMARVQPMGDTHAL